MTTFFMSRFLDPVLALFRIVVGLLFMQHGAQKLFGVLGGFGGTPGGTAEMLTLPWFAGVLEFVGGLLILIGLFTRIVAFLLSGQMAVAYFMVHAPQGFWPTQNGGELAALYAFAFLFLSASGAGRYSIDALWRGRERVYVETADAAYARV